ncbi:lamin tail domain-containing protein [Myxococcota bacterium]|nr:lamin tail domain-containing protein [Myxococcota bacterium]
MMFLWMAVAWLQGCVTVEKTQCVKILADGTVSSCDSATPTDDTDDSEGDADADSDADSDTDADSDADSDADADADTDSDADADPEARIVLNEVLSYNLAAYKFNGGRAVDYFELANLGDAEADIGGWLVTRSPDEVSWEIPFGTLLAPGALLVVVASSTPVSSYENFGYNLNHEVDLNLALTDLDGVERDAVVVMTADNVADTAFARRVDGDFSWAWTTTLTPGEPNVH